MLNKYCDYSVELYRKYNQKNNEDLIQEIQFENPPV